MPLILPPPHGLRTQFIWGLEHRFDTVHTHLVDDVSVGWLWYVVSGEIEVSFHEPRPRQFCISAGEWFWCGPCRERRINVGRSGARWFTIGMTAHCGERDWFVPTEPTLFTPVEAERGRKLVELLCTAQGESELERDGLCRSVCAWLWRSAQSALPVQTPAWARSCLEAIEANPHVSVNDLTRLAHFSPAQFRRLWESQFGQSPRDFLMNKRLEIARFQLETGVADLNQIALSSGFAGSSGLSKAFKNRYGVAALQWRKASRQSG